MNEPNSPLPRRRHFSRNRPAWWPENEEWPPRGRGGWQRMGRHNSFLRRIGCIFGIFFLLGFIGLISVIAMILNLLGVSQFAAGQYTWILPGASLLLAFTIIMAILTGRNLRRMSVPLDDLLAASNRVAEGDYAAQVEEKGPPEMRSLTRAFNSMAARLKRNSDLRRSELAEISHELRTPLTIIQGNVEGILDGMYPADQSRLKSILEETQILGRLVDDLRTLSIAENGVLELKREPVDLIQLVRETVAAFRAQADAAAVSLNLVLDAAEVTLEVDPERIRQVISNLISNALRYTPRQGSIKIHLTESAAGAERSVRIEITDSGPGIATSDLPYIFDRFYKSSDSHGMGLGLSIAKYIVEAHGGSIKAESPAGGGTQISFTLPFESLVK